VGLLCLFGTALTILLLAPSEYHGLEIVCADLDLNGYSFRVIGNYRNGGFGAAAIDYVEASIKFFSKLCSTEQTVVLLGDFNVPELDWHYYHGPDNIIYNTTGAHCPLKCVPIS